MWLIALLLLPWNLDAYRIGDTIDTEIWTPKDYAAGEYAPKRGQMPVFGMDTTATFSGLPERFSISFEEGFRALPWMNGKDSRGAPLEKVEVTFVYSTSGGGEIHSLASRPIYRTDNKKSNQRDGEISVEYKWIEEEAVDLDSGAFIMFLSVFIVSVFFLIDLCGLCDNGEDPSDPYSSSADLDYSSSDRGTDPLAVMGGARIPKYE